MIYQHIEQVRGSDTDEIIIGDASWDNAEQSVKYAWPDSRGHRARGGEVPVGAVPQMVEALVREGYLPRAGRAARHRAGPGAVDALIGSGARSC